MKIQREREGGGEGGIKNRDRKSRSNDRGPALWEELGITHLQQAALRLFKFEI
jgi:hypothetical protein